MSQNRPIWRIPQNAQSTNDRNYNIYRAEIRIKNEDKDSLYSVNSGAFINQAAFQTPTEYDNESVIDAALNAIDSKVGTVENTEKTAKNAFNSTIGDPGWTFDKVTTVLQKGLQHFLSHQMPHSPSGTAALSLAFKNRNDMYYKMVVDPRKGLVFPLAESIDQKEIGLQGQRLTAGINQSLAAGDIPTHLAAVWIVSDVPPEVVAQNGISLEAQSSTFVCFTEEDAKELASRIEMNYKDNNKLRKKFEFDFSKHHEHSFETIENILIKLKRAQAALHTLTDRQTEYIEDYEQIKEGGLNQGFGRDFQFKALASSGLSYPEFDDTKRLLLMISAVINGCANELRKNQNEINYDTLSEFINRLNEKLKEFTIKHPYQGVQDCPIHALLENMRVIQFEWNRQNKYFEAYEKRIETIIGPNSELRQSWNASVENAMDKFHLQVNSMLQKAPFADLSKIERLEIKHAMMEGLAKVDFDKLYNKRHDKINDVISSTNIMDAIAEKNPNLKGKQWFKDAESILSKRPSNSTSNVFNSLNVTSKTIEAQKKNPPKQFKNAEPVETSGKERDKTQLLKKTTENDNSIYRSPGLKH